MKVTQACFAAQQHLADSSLCAAARSVYLRSCRSSRIHLGLKAFIQGSGNWLLVWLLISHFLPENPLKGKSLYAVLMVSFLPDLKDLLCIHTPKPLRSKKSCLL